MVTAQLAGSQRRALVFFQLNQLNRRLRTQRANELGAKVDAVLKELRHATKKSGWGQLTQ